MNFLKASICCEYYFLSTRRIWLIIGGKVTELRSMDLDIPQAWPISPLLILIYTSSLHTNISECGAHVMWFIDDITIYKSSRDIDKNNTKPAYRVSSTRRPCSSWENSDLSKFLRLRIQARYRMPQTQISLVSSKYIITQIPNKQDIIVTTTKKTRI